MKNWYAVMTKGQKGEHDRAAHNLREQGFDVFNPEVTVESVKKGKLGTNVEPLFPGYMFVKFDPTVDSCSPINNTRGVKKIVAFGNKENQVLAPIPAGVMDNLIEDHSHGMPVISFVPRKDDVVRIEQGPFAGLNAVYLEPVGNSRSRVMLSIMGQMNNVTLSNKEVLS